MTQGLHVRAMRPSLPSSHATPRHATPRLFPPPHPSFITHTTIAHHCALCGTPPSIQHHGLNVPRYVVWALCLSPTPMGQRHHSLSLQLTPLYQPPTIMLCTPLEYPPLASLPLHPMKSHTIDTHHRMLRRVPLFCIKHKSDATSQVHGNVVTTLP